MSMITVKEASRKKKRDILKVFNDDFLKVITEILLNSDDSYKRIEALSNDDEIKRITIKIERDPSFITIIDQAEGISAENMKSLFSSYGNDHSKYSQNNGVRGLFGQGLGDVLHHSAVLQKKANIISFKDGSVNRCDFYYNDDKQIKIVDQSSNALALRKFYNIQGNGTVVEFELPEKVIIPKRQAIKDKIEEFYMLRYILSNPKRQVELIDFGKSIQLNSDKYSVNELEPIGEKEFVSFKYESYTLKAQIELYKKSKTEFNTKILIIDENDVVYDDTYFDFDKSPGIHLITGIVRIPNLGNVIRDYLNLDQPKELLTDSRDGFDKRMKFTQNMFDAIGKVIEKKLDQYNKEKESKPIDISTNKKINQIMKQLNTYYRDLELTPIGGNAVGKKPPANGIQFARSIISITKGKNYGLHLYINPKQINPGEVIKLIYEPSNNVEIKSSDLAYAEEDIKDGIVMKQVVIRGLQITNEPFMITAQHEQYESSVGVNVIEEKIIYPEFGLEFIPKKRNVEPNKETKLHLYFDTVDIPLNTVITITEEYNGTLFPSEQNVMTQKDHLITDSIGFIPITIQTGMNIGEIHIRAQFESLVAKAVIYVRHKEKKDDGYDGLFNKIQLQHQPEEYWQSQLDSRTGTLYINSGHIINTSNMGQLGNDEKQPKFNTNQQKYLFELISDAASKKIIEQLQTVQGIKYKDHKHFLDALQEQKTKIYQSIIN